MILVLFLLACRDDAAQAGAACRDAEQALSRGDFEEAVGRLQEALRFQPRETEKLLYRDREGRHGDPYYPHYVWARARTLQARAETDPLLRRQHLQEALSHLDSTRHPEAAALREPLKNELAAAERRASAPPDGDPDLSALQRKVLGLCDQERFEEALRTLRAGKAILERFPPEGAQMAALVDERLKSVLGRYERAMILALDAVSVASPADKPESIPQILQPALLPRTVLETPPRRFVWLGEFLDRYPAELPTLQALDRAETSKVLQSARVFEELAVSAADAGVAPGVRAALRIAAALRGSRMSSLAGGRDDGELDRLLRDGEEAMRRLEERRLPKDLFASQAAALQSTREKLTGRNELRGELERWLASVDHAMTEPVSMSDPAFLRELGIRGASCEGVKAWGELPGALRAHTLAVRAILDLFTGLLAAEAPGPLQERVGTLLRSARALDPGVTVPWKDRLSPKILPWVANP
ncbi:MAG TPA: hypothetical protein VE981_09015 [Planctomycetota bacterium]|nr:hypothetical protein [Planctomycetota bacterium]